MRLFLACVLALFLLAAPAGASERSEARALIAALQPATLTLEEQTALTADWQARAAAVAAACLPDVRAAARRKRRTTQVLVAYLGYASAAWSARRNAWLLESQARIEAVALTRPVLRAGRAARATMATQISQLDALYPADAAAFCGELAAWRAGGFQGRLATWKRMDDWSKRDGRDTVRARALLAAGKLLRRHGAGRRVRAAWIGDGVPMTPAEQADPVMTALFPPPPRDGGKDAPTRTPSW